MYSIQRERDRIEKMERDALEERLELEFQQGKKQKQLDTDEKTRKNREKRKKRKLKEIQKKTEAEGKALLQDDRQIPVEGDGKGNGQSVVGEASHTEVSESVVSNDAGKKVPHEAVTSMQLTKEHETNQRSDRVSLEKQDDTLGRQESEDKKQTTKRKVTNGGKLEEESEGSDDSSDDGRKKKKFILQYKRI